MSDDVVFINESTEKLIGNSEHKAGPFWLAEPFHSETYY